jgi:hypothetical protein
MTRRLHWKRGFGACAGFAFALALAVAGAPGCSGGSGSGGDGGPTDSTTTPVDGEPAICLAFTEAGAPCSPASPVRCFAECEAGGCYCSQTPAGSRWVCVTDLSCLPDCAPVDDGCSPVPTGDDGSGDDGGGDDGGGNDGGGDASDAGAGGDAGGDTGDAASSDAGTG